MRILTYKIKTFLKDFYKKNNEIHISSGEIYLNYIGDCGLEILNIDNVDHVRSLFSIHFSRHIFHFTILFIKIK